MATDTTNGNGIPLDAAQATITTCTISVHVIRIGKRQLTQSVFRQLPERKLIYQDGPALFDGAEVWGWVNYLSEDGGRQFIVQFDDKLYRCKEYMIRSDKFDRYNERVVPSGYKDLKTSFVDSAEFWYLAVILSTLPSFRLNPYQSDFATGTIRYDTLGSVSISKSGSTWNPGNARYFDRKLQNAIGSVIALSGKRDSRYTPEEWDAKLAEARDNLIEAALEYGSEREWVADTIHWLGEMARWDNEAETFRREWDAIIDQLEAVEQLYIAT